jgi:hypothetical protein
MHPTLKVTLVILFEALAVTFAFFFVWLTQQQYYAIEESHLVEIQSGTAFLLLPLILPLLHLMSIAEKRFTNSPIQAKFRKLQSKLFILLVLILLGSGLVVNQMVLMQLKLQGYQACSVVSHQTRSTFTTYSKDSALCPKS